MWKKGTGTAPLIPYLPVYINQNLHISYKGIGLIYTLLPFFGLIVKAASGALADWLHAHKIIFLSSIALCGISFFSIYFVPAMPTQENSKPGHVQFDCSSPTSYLRHPLTEQNCWSKFDENGTATCELQCDFDPKTVNEICKDWNISLSECAEVFEVSTFSYMNHSIKDSAEMFFPVSNLSFMGTEVNHPQCSHPIRANCTVKCDNDELMSFLGEPNTINLSTYSQILTERPFWLFLTLIALAWSGLAISVVMTDTICFKILDTFASKYGEQRLFGSIGWGSTVIFTGYLIDKTSDSNSKEKNYGPAFFLSACVMAVDLFVATRLKVEGENKEHSNIRAVWKLATDPRIMLFVSCCFVVGLSTGVLWTYQLILVEQTVHAWDCNFEHLKLLQGLIIGVSCFGGELPFFFISGRIIEKLGHIHSMSLVIAVFGLRFVLYSLVVNPWLFLPIELLNGFTFGIFYAAMTSFASIIAPPGAQATVQGIFGATFEGLGMASGGLIGGTLFATVGGANAFKFVGFLNAGYAIFHVILQFILNKLRPTSLLGSPSAGGYLPPSDSRYPVVHDQNGNGDAVHHDQM